MGDDFSFSIGDLDPGLPRGTAYSDMIFSIGGIELPREKYNLTFTEVPDDPHDTGPVIPSLSLPGNSGASESSTDASPVLHNKRTYDESDGTSLIGDILSGNYRNESVVVELAEKSTEVIPLIELDYDESDDDSMCIISEISSTENTRTAKSTKTRSVSVEEELPTKRARTKRIPAKKIVAALEDSDDSDGDCRMSESGIVSGNDVSEEEDEELEESQNPEDVYFVEKILFLSYQFVEEVGANRRKRLSLQPRFFVKWWKWADEFNSWVTEEDMGSDGELIVALKDSMSKAIAERNSMEDVRNHLSGTETTADIPEYAIWDLDIEEEDKHSLALMKNSK